MHPTAMLAFQSFSTTAALEAADRRKAGRFFSSREWLQISVLLEL